ncbi:MAG: T9SS type A sorting domain-containing protein [Paludibacter sp.]|nr:T9SS type A sorting domain-containing protein [Paludibacter sp.]
MKQKIFTFLLVALSLVGMGGNVSAQAVGDYGLPTGGEWNTIANWKTWDGAAFTGTAAALPTEANVVYIPAGVTATVTTTTAVCLSLIVNGTLTNAARINIYGDITVNSGGNLTQSAQINCMNVTVNTGGIFQGATTNASAKSLFIGYLGTVMQPGNFTIINNGQFGGTAIGVNDGIGVLFSLKASSFTISGTPTTTGATTFLSRLMPTTDFTSANAVFNMNINQNLTLTFPSTSSGFSLQSNKDTNTAYLRKCTIAAGSTVTLGSATTIFHSTTGGSPTPAQGNMVYQINGTLDLGTYDAQFALCCTAFAGSEQSLTVNVGSTGTLILGKNVKLYNASAGQSASIVPAVGSTIIYGGIVTPTFLLSSTGINSIAVGGAGSGYTGAPTVTISEPDIPGGVQATATAGVAGTAPNQTVNSINITNPGSGYITSPLVTLSGNALAGTSVLGSGTAPTLPTQYSNLKISNTAGVTLPAGGAVTVLSDMTVNSPVGVTLGSDLAVNGNLTLNNGLLTTGANALTVGSNSGASATSYVNGKLTMQYTAAGSKTFPIGKGGNYRPVTLNLTATDAPSTISIDQTESAFTGAPSNTTAGSRKWTITQTGAISYAFNLTLDGTGFSPVGTPVILQNDGSSVSSHSSTGTYTASGLTSVGEFALGDSPTGINTPLDGINTTFSVVNSTLILNNITSKASVRVFDAIGRLVSNKTANGSSMEIKLPAKGFYTVQLENNTGSKTIKIANQY